MNVRIHNIGFLFLLVSSLMLSGCTKDMFNPDYDGNKNDNPLGLNVPDRFDWSSLSTATMTVNVNDKFMGKYDYLLEIYDENPLYGGRAHLLGVGIAKQGQSFTSTISYPQAIERIYVKQTDPRGRVTVKSFAAAASKGTINCDFNSFKEEAVTRAKPSVEVPEHHYTEIPSDAEEITGDSQNDWMDKNPRTKNFKITGNYTGGIYHNGGKSGLKLFVSGTWTLPEQTTGNWQYSIEQGLDVIVLPGGKIIANGKDKTLAFKARSSMIVMEGGNVECKGSLLYSNEGYLYNKGTVQTGENLIMQSNSGIYNFCTIKINGKLEGNAANSTVYQDKGVIESREVVFNNMEVRLLNGSMIKAARSIDGMSNTSYYAEGENASLVKSPEIKCTSSVLYSGNLVIESDNHTPGGGPGWSPYMLKNGASMARYDQSEVVIEACDGTGNAGNQGGAPENPKYPIIIDTTGDDYIFAMEDSWPSYGDYDMNDVVVKFSRNKVSIAADGSKSITYQAKVIAMGATRPIAGAIQFDKIAAGQINEVSYSNPKFISDFTLNAQHTEEGQTKAVIPLFGNAKEFCGQNSSYVNVGNNGVSINETEIPVQEITVHFASTVKNEDIDIRNINFFITTNGSQANHRTEIHLAGYEPTDLANKQLFGTLNDNSTKGSFKYLSTTNLPWGLIIPTGIWKCPEEMISILAAFPQFSGWATSGGVENKNWFAK